MSLIPEAAPWLRQERRCVLIIDIVESVRLIERNEEATVAAWIAIVQHVKSALLPETSGTFVKSTGDGMLLQFGSVADALKVAFGCQAFSRAQGAEVDEQDRVYLRMGLEISDILVDEHDIYGHGVNLAARLATLAGPGEIIVSARVRDTLTSDLDADIEDLGDCYLKHVEEPVRAYRVGPPGPRPRIRANRGFGNMLPTLAVIPFSNGGTLVLGEVLAEELIRAISQSNRMNVISRLSTTQFRGSVMPASDIGKHLKANFVLSGTCREHDGKLMAALELTDTRSGDLVWADRLVGDVGGLLLGDQEFVSRIISAMGTAIIKRELQRSRSLPLPTLESYSLLLGAIAAMYRLSQGEFERAEKMLDELIYREPREPLPLAWMGNWHVLKVQQGWTQNADRESRLAQDRTAKALDMDPENYLALTIDGFVQTNLRQDLEVGEARYVQALEINPNAPLAWLLRGVRHAFKGLGDTAVQYTDRALSLSPFDPQKFFYTSLASSANFSAGQYREAKELAQISLKENRSHTSTLRVLAASQWQLGEEEDARHTGEILLGMEPSLTVSSWLRRSPAAETPQGREMAEILEKIGIPK